MGEGNGNEKSGIIFLHGLGPDFENGLWACRLFGPSLGLSPTRNTVSCPKAPKRPTAIIPPTFIPGLNNLGIRSWFNFWAMPIVSVYSPIATEDKNHLEESLETVEDEIEKMVNQGIPKKNIVVCGASQGGAVTLYTAMHSKHKIGGFIPFGTWLPLLKTDPPSNHDSVNKNTPILHINGIEDLIVPIPAGRATSKAMKKVFTNYELKNVHGVHVPIAPGKAASWLRENVP